MQAGDLIVSGKDKAIIHLHGNPSRVECYFKHQDPEIVPCNPHHNDHLQFGVHVSNVHKSGYILVIEWNVSVVREIKWFAYY